MLEIRKHAPWLLRPEYRAPTGVTQALLDEPERLTPKDSTHESPLEKPFEIYVDGGVNRGTDVVKALCLGANAVGVGRGFLFAQSVGGVKGVEHAVGSESSTLLAKLIFQRSFRAGLSHEDSRADVCPFSVLESEILLTLRLLGANKLSDLRPSMVEVKE